VELVANLIKTGATIGAALSMIAALVTLSAELYIASGTFFTFTAFAIYIREINR